EPRRGDAAQRRLVLVDRADAGDRASADAEDDRRRIIVAGNLAAAALAAALLLDRLALEAAVPEQVARAFERAPAHRNRRAGDARLDLDALIARDRRARRLAAEKAAHNLLPETVAAHRAP